MHSTVELEICIEMCIVYCQDENCRGQLGLNPPSSYPTLSVHLSQCTLGVGVNPKVNIQGCTEQLCKIDK